MQSRSPTVYFDEWLDCNCPSPLLAHQIDTCIINLPRVAGRPVTVEVCVLPVVEFDTGTVVDAGVVDVDTEHTAGVVPPGDRSALGGIVAQYPSLNCRSSIAIYRE